MIKVNLLSTDIFPRTDKSIHLMLLTKDEKAFLDKFENGEYIPELLFDDKEILDRIKEHPMAIWKTREI